MRPADSRQQTLTMKTVPATPAPRQAAGIQSSASTNHPHHSLLQLAAFTIAMSQCALSDGTKTASKPHTLVSAPSQRTPAAAEACAAGTSTTDSSNKPSTTCNPLAHGMLQVVKSAAGAPPTQTLRLSLCCPALLDLSQPGGGFQVRGGVVAFLASASFLLFTAAASACSSDAQQ